jgi:hypothetical protein
MSRHVQKEIWRHSAVTLTIIEPQAEHAVARGSRLIIQRGMVMRSVSTDPSSIPLYRLSSSESEALRLSLRCDRPVKHV